MDKNIEMMKKIIEQKKKSAVKNPNSKKGQKVIGSVAKGRNSKKSGGLFDR